MSVLTLESAVREVCEYAFNANAIREGLHYQQFNRVISSNGIVSGDRINIRATVRGSTPQPYFVEVKVRRRHNAGIHVEAICTCPVGFFCKHAVAAIADVCGKNGGVIEREPQPVQQPETNVEVAPRKPSRDVNEWIGALQEPEPPEKTPAPKTVFYVLATDADGETQVKIMYALPRKNGGLGKAKEYRVPEIDADSRLPREDLAILRQLAAVEACPMSRYALEGAFGAAIISDLLATGRCYWEHVAPEKLLKPAKPRTGELAWDVLEDGLQRTALKTTPPAQVMAFDMPWYVDAATMECGPVKTRHAREEIERWLDAPDVEAEESAATAKAVAKLGLPAPRKVTVIERRNVRPKPVLRFIHNKLELPLSRYVPADGKKLRFTYETHTHVTVGQLSFFYDGRRVPYDSDEKFITAAEADRVVRLTRSIELEKQYLNLAMCNGLTSAREFYGYQLPREYANAGTLPSAEAWIDFVRDIVPKLEAQGFAIEYDPAFPYRLAQVQDWYSEAAADAAPGEEGTGNDWFSIELGILVDGQRVNLLPMIRDVLREFEKYPADAKKPDTVDLRLPDGRIARVPTQRILGIAQILAELYDPASLSDGRLKVGKLRAAELTNVPGIGQWKGSEELRELAQRVHSYKGIARVDPPAGLGTTLRPYQLDGLSWLQFLRAYGFGGILADDMGLGKTVQVLAHLLLEKESGRANLPSLVVGPTSLMDNWRAEAERFAPGLRVLVSHGGERREHFERLAEYDLIVTSYSLLTRDEEILTKQPFHLVILDEAQYVKNPNTKWADVTRSLSARHRICMTGTPMENHLGELWSLMTFLSPGYLGNQRQFTLAYRTPIEKHRDVERRKLLGQRLRPFIMRRKKEEVALELPPKTEIQRMVELDGAQRDLYETIRIAMHDRVRAEVAARGMERSQIIILDALLKLRQACCDPRLVKIERARKVKESAKLEMLLEMVPKMVEEGRRILLFSQFTSMLDLIEPEITRRGIGFVRISGDTTDRATPVRRFQAGEVPLFLISLKAGGTGLNLTAADTVIHYDPWWNPAVEQQATDRAHRIGQDKPVFVYKLVTSGTVEEKIVAMQEKKRELVAGLLGEGAQQSLKLSRDELEHLFDPLA